MSAARVYYVFTALTGLGMACTITAYTPFLQSIGLSLGEIALVNSIYWAVVISAELPTGMLADGRSRAWSLRAGVVFFALGALSYVFATGFWSAAFSEALIAIGTAFLSGAQQAWLADALTREGNFDRLRSTIATGVLIRSGLMLVGGLAGASIALISYRLIWLPFVLTGSLAAIFSWRYMNGRGEALEYTNEWIAFRRALSALTQSYALAWSIAALIIFGAVVSFNHFWALYFIPQVGTLGLSWVWAIIYTGFGGAAYVVRRLTIANQSEPHLMSLAILMSGLGLVRAAIAPELYLAIPAVVLHEFGRGMFEPLSESYVQHRVHTTYRATFGSLQSFLGRIGYAVVPFVVWFSIEGQPNTPQTISLVWMVCAAVLIVGAIGLWIARPRTRM
jgi:MFS family permease